MSYAVKSLFLLAFCGLGMSASLRAEEATAKAGRIIVLDGKRVRVDDNMKVLEHLDGKPEAAAPAGSISAAPVAVVSAEDALRAERNLSRQALVQDSKLRSAVQKLATPGWREARVELIGAGKAAVPYLIEAIGGGEASNPVPAYSLGGHTKFDTGRASRQRSLAEVATEVLTQLVKTHSDYKGDIPTMDQRAWQTWWTANGASVTFGKPAGLD